MNTSINVYAGSIALKKIQAEGFQQNLFNVLAGASGGPKWFTLFGLDCYLFGEFFANREQPIHTIGSSAGAWRLSCFAQQEPVAAITRLADYYSKECYSAKPDTNEISDKAEAMLSKVLGAHGAEQIVDNPRVQSHFLVAKAKGFNRFETKPLQLIGLLKAAAANRFSRRTIRNHFERYVFFSRGQNFPESFFNFDDFPTKQVAISNENLHSVLMASGSIPLVLRGVKQIQGAPQGIYRDGGIIDYHLDVNFSTEKLVLYPHFFPIIKPGWFDKGIKSRKASLSNYQNVVLITPSPSHIESLPYKKISDRNDFQTMEAASRMKYWQTILDKSHQMADDFQRMVNEQRLDQIIPIQSIL